MGSEMTTENPDPAPGVGEISEEQRAAIFAAANAPKGRRAALREGRAKVPTKFIVWSIVAVLLLGLGGEIGQHFFETYGKAPSVTTPSSPVLNPTTTTTPATPNLISLQVFMRLKGIGTAVAPTFTLQDQRHRRWSLAAQHGKVVVLTFYNAICNDICPVLGAEIRQASQELGGDASRIEFAIVNTDPQSTTISADTGALRAVGLSNRPSVVFLSGSVTAMNSVWGAYGVRIAVGAKPGEVSHNNALYFITPNGYLADYAVPFGTEDTTGRYSLDPSSLRLYALAIAETAESLVS